MNPIYDKYLTSPLVTQTYTYKLRLVTPLAAHGANKNKLAQFLPSSVKGVYHYWFRAVTGAEKSGENLKVAEAQIFGSTMVKKHVKKSVVTFGVSALPSMDNRNKVKILYHKNGGTTPAFKEGATVELTLSVLKRHKQELMKLDALTRLILQIGGFGLRSRRGLGSCQLEDMVYENQESFTDNLQKNLVDFGAGSLYAFRNNPEHLLSIKNMPTSEQPVLLNVWIGQAFEDVNSILTAIGYASHEAKKVGNLGNSKPRQASPLHVTVRQIGGKYVPVFSEVGTAKGRAGYRRAMIKFLTEMGVQQHGQ